MNRLYNELKKDILKELSVKNIHKEDYKKIKENLHTITEKQPINNV